MLSLSRIGGAIRGKGLMWGCRRLTTTTPALSERNVCFSISSWFCLPHEEMKEFELLSRASASVFFSPSSSLSSSLSPETTNFLESLSQKSTDYHKFLNKMDSSLAPQPIAQKRNQHKKKNHLSLSLCPTPLQAPFSRTLELISSFPSLSLSVSPVSPLSDSRNYHIFGAGHVTHPYNYLSLFSKEEQSWLRHLQPQNTIFWLEIHTINSDNKETTPAFALPLSSDPLIFDRCSSSSSSPSSSSFSLSSLPIRRDPRDLALLHFPNMEINNIFEAAVLKAMQNETENNTLFMDDLFKVEKSPLCFFISEEEEQKEMQKMQENEPRLVNCEGIEVNETPTSYTTTHTQIHGEDVFYFGDQRFAKPNKTLEMGICGGPVRSQTTHRCVGVVEGSVPDNSPPLPVNVLREFPALKDVAEEELKQIGVHLAERMKGTACYVAWPKVLAMIQEYEKKL